MRAESRLFLLGLSAIVLVNCAKGTAFSGAGGSGGSGEGASDEGAAAPGGSGQGASGTGASTPNGGTGAGTTSTPTGETTTPTGGTTTSDTGTTSTTSNTGTTSTTSDTGTTSTTSDTGTTSTTSTTTINGGSDGCEPMQPSLVCLASEHCFPQPDGSSICQGPVGASAAYGACVTPSDCTAETNCIDTGAGGNACCLTWCTGDADCSFFETCNFLATPVYVGGTEYGVCYDGLGGC